jgi:glycine betaine catabolism B
MGINITRPAHDARTVEYWDPQVDNELVCVDVHAETHDVKTFTFAACEGKHVRFSAGQYFAFETDLEGETETRCYSISSSPLRTNVFSITVKRVAGGRISNWLHDNLIPGTIVRTNGPLGQFIRPAGKDRKFLFLSGGSGITPVMSMVRELADATTPVDVVFLHAARTPADFVFRSELTNIANRLKGLRLYLLPEDLAGEQSWPGLSGRISNELLQLTVPDIAARTVMCCGPAPFMAAARKMTAELGVPPERYIEESFDAAVEDVPATLPDTVEDKVFKVAFSKQGKSIQVSTQQTVLSVAKKSGVRIPSACSNGLCGTCKSKLTSGFVDMKPNGGIRQREIDAGFFLPCCSKPLSDLVIDR